MKIVLLGSNGQLGSDIKQALISKMPVANLIEVNRGTLDVSNVNSVAKVLRDLDFEFLINCTSYHKTDLVEDNAPLAFAINAHSVQAMAQLCDLKQAKFFHFSTDYVFGRDYNHFVPYTEAECVGPVNVYGASKSLGENLSLMVCENVFIFRVASLFGLSGSSAKGGNFVETMVKIGSSRGHLKVVSDQLMSPTYTKDVADCILQFVKGDFSSGVYHIVNTGSASWYDFAKEIISQSKIKAVVEACTSEEFSSRAMRPNYSVLDNSKVTNVSGVMMPDWQQSLSRYLRSKSLLN